MSQLHFQLKSLELVRSGSLDLFAHSLVGPLLHAVESLADVHLGGIVLGCLLERRKVDVLCRTSRMLPSWSWKAGQRVGGK